MTEESVDTFRARAAAWLAQNRQHAPRDYGAICPPDLVTEAKKWQRLIFDSGFAGIHWPTEHGGQGLSPAHHGAWVEECAKVGVPPVLNMVGLVLAGGAVMTFGTDELKKQHLRSTLNADNVWCQLFSEPGAGSDVSGVKSGARKDGDDYVITGQKMWITNSLQADWMCMLVNTGEGPVHKNKSLVMVPLRENGKLRKGIEVAKKIKKIGMNSSDTGLLYFDEVRVPQRNRIGAEGQGFIYQMQQFQEERLWAAASCLQSLTNCIAWTVEWAQERKMFGSTLADQQWVQYKLAEMKTDLESLRSLTYRACELYVDGQDVLELASMAKLQAGRLNRTIPDGCLQFWGGMGYTWENKVSRMFRDGRLASIGGGADEVMLGIIAKTMGVAKRAQRE
jgi:citronellyl-CoA dehydrogenase